MRLTIETRPSADGTPLWNIVDHDIQSAEEFLQASAFVFAFGAIEADVEHEFETVLEPFCEHVDTFVEAIDDAEALYA